MSARFGIPAAATVTAVLTLSVLVGAQQTYTVVTTYYNYSSGGGYNGKSERTSTTEVAGPSQPGESKIQIDGGRWSCRVLRGGGTGPCVPCSSCHVANVKVATRTELTASLQRHESTYFPRAELKLTPGQKLAWATGLHLMLKSRDLVLYTQSGSEMAVFPAGTRILKDARGEPFVIRLPATGEPRHARQPK